MSIDIISSGIGYTSTPIISISSPDVGINTASAIAVISPVYYSIQNSTPTVSGVSTITLSENLPYSVGIGTQVYFRKQSRILGSNHTFEYVGSGVVLSTAFPSAGGKGIQDNETVSQDGGIVIFSSIDQSGNYRIGAGVVVNQNAGTISGSVYTRSLFNNVTPYHFTTLPPSHFTTLPLYHLTTLPRYRFTTITPYHSTTFHFTTLPPYHFTTVSLHHYTTLPLYHFTT